MKLNRAGIGVVGLTAAVVGLTACSSSGSSGGSGSSTSGGASSTTSSSTTSSSATSSSGSTSGGGSASCASGTLNAEGSTAQTNAMTKWVNDFEKQCSGAKVNYNPTGSGPGVSQFNAGNVDFAGSDSALDPTAGEDKAAAKRCGSPAFDLPMVVGPIAVAFKVKGVQSLTLTPALVAKIFQGKITKWNDAAIKAKNSGVSLPSEPISVIYRSDASGTTANFEKFLAATDPTDFTAKPAKDNASTVFKGQGKAKSQGVAAALQGTEGSIGYVEYSFAVSASLPTAAIDNGSGPVQISPANASIAAGEATVTGTGGDLTLKLNYATKAKNAYPMILVTYEIACSKYSDAAKGKLVKAFLNYTSTGGQSGLPQLGYAPLPTKLQAQVKSSVAKIS